jgi:hypothetical protein
MNGWKTLVAWTLCAVVIALVAGWPKVLVWTNANSGLASWVQAVFSVIAISATAGVVLWQHELERKRQKAADVEARTRRHSVVVALSHATWIYSKWLKEKLPDRQTILDVHDKKRYLDMEDIKRFGTEINSVPLHELDDPVMLRDLLMLADRCRTLKNLLIAAISEARTMDDDTYARFFVLVDRLVSDCSNVAIRVKARATQLAVGTHVTKIE